jgi:5-methyltetrahydrofolate--homocysteine methyltransferase
LASALERTQQIPLINSISGEQRRLENILLLVVEYQCPVIVLLMDEKGIPKTVEARLEILDRLMGILQDQGLAHDKLYIDPLTLTLGSDSNSGAVTVETIRTIHKTYPDVHISVGLSNISFGLPSRSVINRTFLTLALQAGLDAAIMDPLDNELMRTIYATNLMLGKDRYCQKYIRAYRIRN